MDTQRANIVSSMGLQITDAAHRQQSDMAAALASSLGHRDSAIVDAITTACQTHLGSAHDVAPAGAGAEMGEPFSHFAASCMVASPSEANEWAIRIARACGDVATAGGSAGGLRHRIVTLLGGQHGDTLACRSANGRIADQAVGGPLAAGFRHIAPSDTRALQNAVDATAAAVLLSPLDWSRGGEPFDADYLAQVRQVCDTNDTLLIIDETRLPGAISGHWFFHQSCGIDADIVTASAGWTGGLPGGMVLVSRRVAEQLRRCAAAHAARRGEDLGDDSGLGPGAAGETYETSSLRTAGLLPCSGYPVLEAVAGATAAAIGALGGPAHAGPLAQQWADAWRELADGFEFISGITTVGLAAVVQLDLPAADVAAAASKRGLRLIISGRTTLFACLPINVTAAQMTQMLGTFRDALETIERQPIES